MPFSRLRVEGDLETRDTLSDMLSPDGEATQFSPCPLQPHEFIME